MSAVEVGDGFGCMDVVGRDPTVVGGVVSFPLHKVLQPTIAYTTIEDTLNFIFFVAIHENRSRWRVRSPSWDPIWFVHRQFDDWEDRV